MLLAKDSVNDTMQHSTVFATFHVICNTRAKIATFELFSTLVRFCYIYDFLQQSNDCSETRDNHDNIMFIDSEITAAHRIHIQGRWS